MAKRKSKKRKTTRAAKTKRTSVKKRKLAAKRPTRKVKKAKKAKKAKRPAARTAAKRSAKKAGRRREVIGEGNYTAAREFRKGEESFVRANKARIPDMGKEAEKALEGPERLELTRAEDEARAHAHE